MLQSYTFTRYFLYSGVTCVEDGTNLAQVNKDIFNCVLPALMDQVIPIYLSGRSCYIPTANEYQSTCIHSMLLRGFEECDYSPLDLIYLSDGTLAETLNFPSIAVGEAVNATRDVICADWTFLYPILDDSLLDAIVSMSANLSLPVPYSRYKWYDAQLDKLTTKLDGSTPDNGPFQIIKKDTRLDSNFRIPPESGESGGLSRWPED